MGLLHCCSVASNSVSQSKKHKVKNLFHVQNDKIDSAKQTFPRYMPVEVLQYRVSAHHCSGPQRPFLPDQ
jgi:hypothetical protein